MDIMDFLDSSVNPAVQPLCGWDWVRQHRHDLDNWEPKMEIVTPKGRHTFSGDRKAVEKAVKEALRRDSG